MTHTHTLLLLPGDGIGTEVIAEAARIIEWLNENTDHNFHTSHALIGGAAIDAEDMPLPKATLDAAKAADAILMGSVGGPKWESMPYEKRPERGLLGLRKAFGLFANLRPAMCFDALADASSLKRDIISGLDIMIVRELTGGLYFGEPRGVTMEDGKRVGHNTMRYYDYEIERIGRVAFDLARKRAGRVCSVDKANVLEVTELWREEMQKLRDNEYTDISLSHVYVDAAAMHLVRNPKQFDVIVTTNMFGDILSDIAAQLTGSLGMLPSAALGEQGSPGLYEPVHGSAPDIAGQNIANPIATILSLAMLLRYSLSLGELADKVEGAVNKTLADGYRTADIMQDGMTDVSTSQMGDKILERLAL